MGFLDNLENSLKTMESREERDPNEIQRKQDERSRTLAAAPWAEKLKDSTYTRNLFEQAAIVGHRLRTKVYMAWFDSTLQLEARERKLELRPTANGIVAAFIEPNRQETTRAVDLDGDPSQLLQAWLGPM